MENILSISANDSHLLAIRNDGRILGYGVNKFGQLGNESREDSIKAVEVKNLERIVYVKAANGCSFAIDQDDVLWAWGRNTNGMLGDGTDTDHMLPAKVTGIQNVWQMEHNDTGIVALTKGGDLWTWGKIGDKAIFSPTKIEGISDVKMVSLCNTRTLVLKNDSTIWECKNDTLLSGTPVWNKVDNVPENIVYIKAFNYSQFAVDGKGQLWSWGAVPVLYDNVKNMTFIKDIPKRLDGYDGGEVMLPND